MANTIYRFKFSPEFTDCLLEFIGVHRFDSVPVFKEAWDIWYAANTEMIDRETTRLLNLGYKGNVSCKMYKSVRYYYKNKSLETKSPKKRRKYIRLDHMILSMIDEHLSDNREKPANSYQSFMERNRVRVKLLTDKLLGGSLSEQDIDLKLKKTFKNRYFRLMRN